MQHPLNTAGSKPVHQMGQGTFAFYNRTESVVPITDTLYCFSYPAIFPLILIYIEALVLKDPDYKRGLLYLLPSFICGISAALIYATISNEEFSEFIGYHYYFQNYDSISGPAWWLVIIHRAFRIIIAVEIPLVLYFGWKYINEYNRMVENYYSNTEDKVVTFIISQNPSGSWPFLPCCTLPSSCCSAS